jgi:hypothetical protein
MRSIWSKYTLCAWMELSQWNPFVQLIYPNKNFEETSSAKLISVSLLNSAPQSQDMDRVSSLPQCKMEPNSQQSLRSHLKPHEQVFTSWVSISFWFSEIPPELPITLEFLLHTSPNFSQFLPQTSSKDFWNAWSSLQQQQFLCHLDLLHCD